MRFFELQLRHASRVEDDGNSRDIDLPYSKVNHLKAQFRQQLTLGKESCEWNLGYQNNQGKNESFPYALWKSTSAGNQSRSGIAVYIKYLQFHLWKWTFLQHENWKHTGGIDLQYQTEKK